jgi:peptidoglycan hydrolase-like protein with peptidoglycan-binding domain
MREKPVVFSALFFSGALALNVATAWSQATPGESSPARPGGTQTERPSGQSMETPGGKSGMSGQWSAEDIKKVQQALKEKGHDPKASDGVMGASTQQALRAFQQANGLKATGTLDAETAAALGVSSGGKSSPSGESGAGGRSSSGEPGQGSGSGSRSPSGSSGGSAPAGK